MRTTLTLDDANYARLQREMHRRRCSFREIVNMSLQRGLDLMETTPRPRIFQVSPSPGGPLPGIDLDCTARLLDRLDGPGHR